jgi:hypothetical protein
MVVLQRRLVGGVLHVDGVYGLLSGQVCEGTEGAFVRGRQEEAD